MKAQVVFVSVTGILAFYQTKVAFHRKAKFLGDRDFFGDCCSAAKKRGMRVVARMSPDLNWDDALQAHPEWFERDENDVPRRSREDTRLIRSCMFTGYMTEYIPAIIREVNSLYDVDAVYTNGWPPLGSLPVCHCAVCRDLPPSGTPGYWDKFNDRMEYLWKLYDGLAKEKEAVELFLCEFGWRRAVGDESGPAGKTLRLVSGRQPGARRRGCAGVAVRAAGAGVHIDSGRKDGGERDGRMVDGAGAVAERGEVSRGSNDVAEPDQRERNGAVLPLDRR